MAQTLICIHHAGGSSVAFHSWEKTCAAVGLAIVPVEFPGRGRRTGEPLLHTVPDLIQDLLLQMSDALFSGEYAIFGHSFGALLAYEAALALEAAGFPTPARVIVSGANPPHRLILRQRHRLTDAELLAYVGRYGGIDDRLRNDLVAFDFLVRILRADYEALETFPWADRGPLNAPLTIVASSNDPATEISAMHDWASYTNAGMDMLELNTAGHLYLGSHRDEILAHVHSALGRRSEPLNFDTL